MRIVVTVEERVVALPAPDVVHGAYMEVRCGWVRLVMRAEVGGMTVEIEVPGEAAQAVPLPSDVEGEFWRLARNGSHAEAWEEVIQYLRNDGGLANLIDSHTELWDGIDGRQPSAPGAVLERRDDEVVHVCCVGVR